MSLRDRLKKSVPPALRLPLDRVLRPLSGLRRSLHILLMKPVTDREPHVDRKSTRLNSSHLVISYAVSCLKKKNKSACNRCNRSVSPPSTPIRSEGSMASALTYSCKPLLSPSAFTPSRSEEHTS